MLKITSAILSAAAIAAVLTIFLAPSGPVDAGPLVSPENTALASCTPRPWPYQNCAGSTVGNAKIRMVTTERLSP